MLRMAGMIYVLWCAFVSRGHSSLTRHHENRCWMPKYNRWQDKCSLSDVVRVRLWHGHQLIVDNVHL